MKKKYIQPTIEVLDFDEDTSLLTGSIIKNDKFGAIDIDARVDNMAFAEDEDISEDVY